MISFETIAQKLESLLNGEDYENLVEYGLTSIIPDTIYAFNICLDTGKYKTAERIDNTVIRYINAQMSIEGNTVEGTAADAYHATLDTRVDFLIPLPELAEDEEDNVNLILSAVRNLLTNTLSIASQSTIEDGNIIYLHTINYTIANTGFRDQVDKVGDCITLSLDIAHQFVAGGVSSDAYEVYIVGGDTEHRVRYQRIGFGRTSVTEANVFATDTADYSSKEIPSSTSFTITMDLITRLDEIDRIVRDYTFNNVLTPVRVLVKNAPMDISKEYYMILNSSGVNGELNLPSSTRISLVEYPDNLL